MDLLSLVKQQLTAATITKIGAFLGESSENTTSALGSALPSILGGLMQKASTNQGVTELLNTIETGQHDGGILDNFSNLLDADDEASSELISNGASLLGGIFGDKVAALGNIISRVSGIKNGSASSLLSMVTPIVIGVLGKQVSLQGMGVSGLATLLMNQKDSVKEMLPTGIENILDVNTLGDFIGNAKTSSTKATIDVAEETMEEKKGDKSWLSWVLLGSLLLGALYYWQSCRNLTEVVDNTTDTTIAKTDSVASPNVDVVKKTLSTGIELNFEETSIENELIKFIEDSSKVVDKTTWFNFRYLRFETGSAKIDSTSMQEVKNIAEILKAYPINIKIGGYTDNVGQEESNMKLSVDRAANVRAALVSMGINSTRLTSEGYGSQHPVATNDTEEGKAQNRRIAVRVTKK